MSDTRKLPKLRLVRTRRSASKRWAKCPLHLASFVARRKDVGLPPSEGKQSGMCFWHVKPSGNYIEDCKAGQHLAAEYLRLGAPVLQWIIADMPQKLTGVEIGFLCIVGEATAQATA